MIRASIGLNSVTRPIEVRKTQVFFDPAISAVADRLMITDGQLIVRTAPLRGTNFTCVGTCFIGRYIQAR